MKPELRFRLELAVAALKDAAELASGNRLLLLQGMARILEEEVEPAQDEQSRASA